MRNAGGTIKLEKLNYERVLSSFQKRDQIFMGFRGGHTHGYIAKIAPEGLYIFQLTNSKTYLYDWEHFEFIAHAGVWCKKEKESLTSGAILQAIPTVAAYQSWRRGINKAGEIFVKEFLEKAPSTPFSSHGLYEIKSSLKRVYERECGEGDLLIKAPHNEVPSTREHHIYSGALFLENPSLGRIITLLNKDERSVRIKYGEHHNISIGGRKSILLDLATNKQIEFLIGWGDSPFQVKLAFGLGWSETGELRELGESKIKDLISRGPQIIGDPWLIDGHETHPNIWQTPQGTIVANARASRYLNKWQVD